MNENDYKQHEGQSEDCIRRCDDHLKVDPNIPPVSAHELLELLKRERGNHSLTKKWVSHYKDSIEHSDGIIKKSMAQTEELSGLCKASLEQRDAIFSCLARMVEGYDAAMKKENHNMPLKDFLQESISSIVEEARGFKMESGA